MIMEDGRMAKINNSLAAIKSAMNNSGIEPDKGKRTTKKVTRYLLSLFTIVDDPRITKLISYPLEYILLIAFLAVLGNANTWQEINDFGISKKRWLSKFLDVKKYGIPSHDTFRRVFGIIGTKQLESLVVSLMEENLTLIKRGLHIESDPHSYRLLCVDGKEENGTGRKYSSSHGGKVRNLQTLHIYDFTNQVCLASVPIEEKSNEIPAAQSILSTMELEQSICTFDAINMQKNTISIIRNNHGHFVGGLKGNQGNLMKKAISQFTESNIKKLKESSKPEKPIYIVTEEHAHSQKEVREYFLVKAKLAADQEVDWKDLKFFILCIKTITPDNPDSKQTTERRYYVSDLDDLSLISEAIRHHWSVEQFHWQLDASFYEDDNSTMDKTAYNNLSLLNKLSLHLIQLMKLTDKKVSVNRIRKRFGWDFEGNMEALLSFFHEDAIIQALKRNDISKLELSDN